MSQSGPSPWVCLPDHPMSIANEKPAKVLRLPRQLPFAPQMDSLSGECLGLFSFFITCQLGTTNLSISLYVHL